MSGFRLPNPKIRRGLTLVVELGYEFQAWMGAAHRISGIDDGLTSRSARNLMFMCTSTSNKKIIDDVVTYEECPMQHDDTDVVVAFE